MIRRHCLTHATFRTTMSLYLSRVLIPRDAPRRYVCRLKESVVVSWWGAFSCERGTPVSVYRSGTQAALRAYA